MPTYLSQAFPRNRDVIRQLRLGTVKFNSSIYPSCLMEWNKQDNLIKASPIIASFTAKLLVLIRPNANSVYDTQDPVGLSFLTQLLDRLSKLHLHKFKHNFRMLPGSSPMFPIFSLSFHCLYPKDCVNKH